MPQFNLKQLILDVFQPVLADRVTVIVDRPHGTIKDNAAWMRRREMANEWHDGFMRLSKEIGFEVRPMLFYDATGAHNADLPLKGLVNDKPVELGDVFKNSTLIIALTEYSATAPLIGFIKEYPYLRAASMPGCIKEMEQTALAADYKIVAEMAGKLSRLLDKAETAEVTFSTGHKCFFDLRFNDAKRDDGMLPPQKEGMRLINLPSGEAFKVPYEGDDSRTSGELPVNYSGELVIFHVENNRITKIIGDGPEAKRMDAYFGEDPARRNIAEFGLGCNHEAIARGIVLEDEKAGFHWAYGRSEHIGGRFGADKFRDRSTVVHQDIIYSKGSPITVRSIELVFGDGQRQSIWDGKWYSL